MLWMSQSHRLHTDKAIGAPLGTKFPGRPYPHHGLQACFKYQAVTVASAYSARCN